MQTIKWVISKIWLIHIVSDFSYIEYFMMSPVISLSNKLCKSQWNKLELIEWRISWNSFKHGFVYGQKQKGIWAFHCFKYAVGKFSLFQFILLWLFHIDIFWKQWNVIFRVLYIKRYKRNHYRINLVYVRVCIFLCVL